MIRFGHACLRYERQVCTYMLSRARTCTYGTCILKNFAGIGSILEMKILHKY